MRGFRPTALTFCALAAAAAAPSSASAQASPGGASAESGPLSLFTQPQGLVGRAKVFTGNAGRGASGKAVTIERYDQLSGQWSMLTRAKVGRRGGFKARWKADQPGPARVRARLDGRAATTATKPPEVAITLFRAHRATWYGPGFYGNRTACGQKMTRRLVGVAHKKLRCGAKVRLLHRGRTVTVPVVDRGPYVRGITWDLTAATARQLGFEGSKTIGALRVAEARRRR